MTAIRHRRDPNQPEHIWLLLMATIPSGMLGCWEHGGGIDTHGYGRAQGQRKAHRVMYEALIGPVPHGLVLDHLCHNADATCPGGPTCRHRRCLNPAHMEPKTTGANVSARPRGAHCKRGHDDWIITASGHRKCAQCQRDGARARYQARQMG